MSTERPTADNLVDVLYLELRNLAAGYLRRERGDCALSATGLVHEAYVRIRELNHIEWQGRTHFLALAATTMRRVLVNHARRRQSLKRGGGAKRLTLSDSVEDRRIERPLDILRFDECLTRLRTHHDRQSRVVELRIFGGLETTEIAEALGVSTRTVKGDWRAARAWLLSELDEAAA